MVAWEPCIDLIPAEHLMLQTVLDNRLEGIPKAVGDSAGWIRELQAPCDVQHPLHHHVKPVLGR